MASSYYKQRDYGLDAKVVLYQLAFHCELMYDYLTETGKKVPEWIGSKLSEINKVIVKKNEERIKTNHDKDIIPLGWWQWIKKRKAKREYIKKTEAEILKMHIKVADELGDYKDDLPKIFNELSTACQPSTPCTLENTIPTHRIFIFFGQKTIQFLRDMGLLSLLFLFAYSIFSLLYSNYPQNGLIFQALLVCAAGVGACFYSLNSAKRYVVSRTFDDKFIPHYYNRIIIGVIAGVILANFIDVSSISGKTEGTPIVNLSASLISLLGGFSSDFVVRFLNRLLAMIQTLIEGDTKEIIENKIEQTKMQLKSEQLKQNIGNVAGLRKILDSSDIKPGSEAYKSFNDLIQKMISI